MEPFVEELAKAAFLGALAKGIGSLAKGVGQRAFYGYKPPTGPLTSSQVFSHLPGKVRNTPVVTGVQPGIGGGALHAPPGVATPPDLMKQVTPTLRQGSPGERGFYTNGRAVSGEQVHPPIIGVTNNVPAAQVPAVLRHEGYHALTNAMMAGRVGPAVLPGQGLTNTVWAGMRNSRVPFISGLGRHADEVSARFNEGGLRGVGRGLSHLLRPTSPYVSSLEKVSPAAAAVASKGLPAAATVGTLGVGTAGAAGAVYAGAGSAPAPTASAPAASTPPPAAAPEPTPAPATAPPAVPVADTGSAKPLGGSPVSSDAGKGLGPGGGTVYPAAEYVPSGTGNKVPLGSGKPLMTVPDHPPAPGDLDGPVNAMRDFAGVSGPVLNEPRRFDLMAGRSPSGRDVRDFLVGGALPAMRENAPAVAAGVSQSKTNPPTGASMPTSRPAPTVTAPPPAVVPTPLAPTPAPAATPVPAATQTPIPSPVEAAPPTSPATSEPPAPQPPPEPTPSGFNVNPYLLGAGGLGAGGLAFFMYLRQQQQAEEAARRKREAEMASRVDPHQQAVADYLAKFGEHMAKAALGTGSPFSSDVPAAPKKPSAPKSVSPTMPKKPAGPGYTVVNPGGASTVAAPRLQVPMGDRPPATPAPAQPRRGSSMSTVITPDSGKVVRPAPAAPPPRPVPPPPPVPSQKYEDAVPGGPTQNISAEVPKTPATPAAAALDATVPSATKPPTPNPGSRPGFALGYDANAPAPKPQAEMDPARKAMLAYFVQQGAPTAAAIGGPAGLLAMIDGLGRGGENMQTMFGRGGQQATPPATPPAAPPATTPESPPTVPTTTPPAGENVSAPTREPGQTGLQMAGTLGAAHYGGKGVQRAAGTPWGARMFGKAPGWFKGSLPVSFALDGLDMLGINPLGERFGQGGISRSDLRQKGRDMGESTPLAGGLSGLGAPLTTIATGLQSTVDAGAAVQSNAESRDRLLAQEQKAAPGGVVNPDAMQKGKYYDEAPGWFDWGAGMKAFGKVQDEAWNNSWIPGVNYINPLIEASTEGLLMRNNQRARNRAAGL